MGHLTKTKNLNYIDPFFQDWDNFIHKNWVLNSPDVNVHQMFDRYILECAAPGLKKEDFKIELNGNLLSVEVSKKSLSETELNYSSFSHFFNLPQIIESDQISAKYEDGILKLELPKKQESEQTKLKIKVY
ncbi:Hsp20/alpha crystallin family protein [Leptospira noguchii]|uniref:Hsp20/alpha crystallin family protein n=2 Tax=Leptospira noguchii TaxID=28182 RepID=T0FEZ4_9LEPT|nr:Hsp20/alpha crystallin family protein [Leptospira noguchii]EMO52222.1 Hsp20/alpha crystallin family protein [Leptospira noguchii]EQA71798.1 Hsp20/alpha crystallin family protein [Leptospira noguchii serovar Panama str. CZ214]